MEAALWDAEVTIRGRRTTLDGGQEGKLRATGMKELQCTTESQVGENTGTSKREVETETIWGEKKTEPR